MSFSAVSSYKIPPSTLPSHHDSQKDTEACISFTTPDSNPEDLGANPAQSEGPILSSDATISEDACGRLAASQTPLDEMRVLANVLLLLLWIQTVAGTGLLLLAQFGAHDISVWLCKHSGLGFYVFFFTQTVGVHLYYKITQLSTVEGTRTHLLMNCSVVIIQVLVFVAMVVQMMQVYCSVSKHTKHRLEALGEGLQE